MNATGSLPQIWDGTADFISANYREPTLPELLADPLTRALMKADQVDSAAAERMLHEVAGRLRAGGGTLANSLMAFDEGAGFIHRASPYTPWRSSLDLYLHPTTARFMHGAVRTKASELACGRTCSW
jgi:hypothetical protein